MKKNISPLITTLWAKERVASLRSAGPVPPPKNSCIIFLANSNVRRRQSTLKEAQ